MVERIEELGGVADDGERALFARLLTLFVEQAPGNADAVGRAVESRNAPVRTALRREVAVSTRGFAELAEELCG